MPVRMYAYPGALLAAVSLYSNEKGSIDRWDEVVIQLHRHFLICSIYRHINGEIETINDGSIKKNGKRFF